VTGTSNSYLELTDRGLIGVGGSDARDFLQNLVSNDISRVTPARAVYAALLTPQGKYLFDFFVVQLGEVLLLYC
jgi:folate-binding Fe-S cluster repair protein YgfZ